MVKAPFKAPVTAPYRALADGWIAGQRVAAGDLVELTAGQAKYEPVEPVEPEKPAPAKRRAEAQSS